MERDGGERMGLGRMRREMGRIERMMIDE